MLTTSMLQGIEIGEKCVERAAWDRNEREMQDGSLWLNAYSERSKCLRETSGGWGGFTQYLHLKETFKPIKCTILYVVYSNIVKYSAKQRKKRTL